MVNKINPGLISNLEPSISVRIVGLKQGLGTLFYLDSLGLVPSVTMEPVMLVKEARMDTSRNSFV